MPKYNLLIINQLFSKQENVRSETLQQVCGCARQQYRPDIAIQIFK